MLLVTLEDSFTPAELHLQQMGSMSACVDYGCWFKTPTRRRL